MKPQGAVMGIDPGTKGGVCVLSEHGDVWYLEPIRSHYTYAQAVAVVQNGWPHMRDHYSFTCYLEKVGVMPRDGRVGAFTFGKITGILAGAVIASGGKIIEVGPQRWQSAMECLTGGNKNVSKDRAKELFPELGKRITHLTADALLIAEYGRRRLYAEPVVPPLTL